MNEPDSAVHIVVKHSSDLKKTASMRGNTSKSISNQTELCPA